MQGGHLVSANCSKLQITTGRVRTFSQLDMRCLSLRVTSHERQRQLLRWLGGPDTGTFQRQVRTAAYLFAGQPRDVPEPYAGSRLYTASTSTVGLQVTGVDLPTYATIATCT